MAIGTLLSLLPALLPAVAAAAALHKRCDVFSALTEGARKGMEMMGRILPSLICLLPAIYMLRASGALTALTVLSEPLLTRLGVPAETLPLMLLRPFSGSGALSLGSELMETYGADSPVGRTAAVMLGSTETTFYVLTVYFGAAGIRRSRHAAAAALCADLAGFLAAAWCVRLWEV